MACHDNSKKRLGECWRPPGIQISASHVLWSENGRMRQRAAVWTLCVMTQAQVLQGHRLVEGAHGHLFPGQSRCVMPFWCYRGSPTEKKMLSLWRAMFCIGKCPFGFETLKISTRRQYRHLAGRLDRLSRHVQGPGKASLGCCYHPETMLFIKHPDYGNSKSSSSTATQSLGFSFTAWFRSVGSCHACS